MSSMVTGTTATRRIRFVLGLAVAICLVAAPAVAEDDEGWSGEVSASLTAQTGTTDSVSGSVDAKAERSWEKDVASIRFSALYGTTRNRGTPADAPTKDEVTQNSQGLFGDWKRTIHERFFWDTKSELSRDNIQDRELRGAVNTGPGYRVWQNDERPKKKHFDLSAGLGYRYELYDGNTNVFNADSTPNNTGDEDHFVDVVASFEYKNLLIEDKLEFTHVGTAKMPANAPDQFILSTEVILGVPITEAWSFRASFFAEYINSQPDFINNTTTRTTFGLGYKF